MDLQRYQPLARRTLKELPTLREHLNHMSIGVIGEIGEFADAIKKCFIYGALIDKAGPKDGPKLYGMDAVALDYIHVNLEEEGGDAWWYTVGYVPELKLNLNVLQTAFDYGAELAAEVTDPVGLVIEANAQIAAAALTLADENLVHDNSGRAVAAAQIIARNYGRLYTYFGLSLDRSLDRNIAKLAKRYGDRYSDEAALVRDLQGEFSVLSAKPLGDLIGAPLGNTSAGLNGTDPIPQRVVDTSIPPAFGDENTVVFQGGEQLVASAKSKKA